MDDAQRQPKDSDRAGVIARINRAGDEGRISLADRDIRLGNARSATSMAELDLMTRELDQLDAALPPRSQGPAGAVEDRPWSTFQPGASSDDPSDNDVSDIATAAIPQRIVAILVSVVVAIAIVVAGVVWVGYSSTGHTDGNDGPDPGSQTGKDPGGDPGSSGTKYSLKAAGISGFLKTYRARFGTSNAVEMTLFDGYAVVGVPIPGKARQQSWLYRDQKWREFGTVRAVFPGTVAFDTTGLDVPALVRNIRRAKRTLNVEKPKAYVIIRHIKTAEDRPQVDVHVSNEFNESGYLATTMDGKVVRSFAYATQ